MSSKDKDKDKDKGEKHHHHHSSSKSAEKGSGKAPSTPGAAAASPAPEAKRFDFGDEKRKSMMAELGLEPKGKKGTPADEDDEDEDLLDEDEEGEDYDEDLDEEGEGDEDGEEDLEDDEDEEDEQQPAAARQPKTPRKAPAPAANSSDKPVTPPNKGPVSYAEYVELKHLLDAEREEREAMQKKWREAEALLEQSRDAVKKQTAMVRTALEAKLAERDEQIADLEYELEELQQSGGDGAPAKASAADEAELLSLRTEKGRLEEEASRGSGFAGKMKSEMQAIVFEVGQVLTKTANAPGPMVFSEKALKKLKKEKELAPIPDAYKAAMDQWTAMRASLTTVSASLRALNDNAAQVQKQYDDRLLAELKTLRATLKEMQVRVDEADASKDADQRREKELQTLRDQLAAAKKESAASKEALQKATEKAEQLESSKDEAAKAKEEAESLRKKAEELQQQLAVEKDKLEVAEKSVAEGKDKLAESIKSLEAEKTASHERQQSISGELKQAKEQLAAAESKKGGKGGQMDVAVLIALKEKVQKLAADYQAANKAVRVLKANIPKLSDAVEKRLLAQIAKNETRHAEVLRRYKVEVKRCRDEIKKLQGGAS